MYVHNASSSALWRQPRTPRKGQPPPLHPCAQGCMYISWLPSFDLLTYIHTYVRTPLCTHICTYIYFRTTKPKSPRGGWHFQGPWGYITHPPGSPHTQRLFIYIHMYVHTYTHIHIHTYVQTYVHTYWREAPGGRRKVPGTYITWILVGYIHMYSGPTLAPSV